MIVSACVVHVCGVEVHLMCLLKSLLHLGSTLFLEGGPLTLFPETDSIALAGRQAPWPVQFPRCGLQGRTTTLGFRAGLWGMELSLRYRLSSPTATAVLLFLHVV